MLPRKKKTCIVLCLVNCLQSMLLRVFDTIVLLLHEQKTLNAWITAIHVCGTEHLHG